MVFPIILMSLSTLTLAYFLFEKIKAYSLKAVFIKTICSLLFIGLGIYSFYHSGFHRFSPFAIMALVFGMLGDIFLEMKYVFREKDKEFTRSGFLVFGIGHILYVIGMFLEFFHDHNVLFIIVPLLLAIVMGALCIILEKPFKVKYDDFKWICFAYAITLFATSFSAFSLWMANGFNNTTLLLVFIGGVFFAISDLILNTTYFGEGHEKPFDLISNTVTYYIAQNLIAFSLFFL